MSTPYKNALVPFVSAHTVGTSAIQLSTTSLLAQQLTFYANTVNAGVVYIGDSSVDSTASIQLSAGDTFTVHPVSGAKTYLDLDLSGWYAVASASGQKLSVTRMKRKS